MAKSKGVGGGCALLFCLPFFAVAVFMAWLLIRDVSGWMEVQDWQEVPATVIEAAVKHGDGTTRATCTYIYEWEGKTWESERIARHGYGSDNIGSWQSDWARRLAKAKQHGDSIPCFVNPDDPSFAVLTKKLRGGMLLFYGAFLGTFGLVGGGGVAASLWSIFGKRKESEAPATRPWLKFPEWQGQPLKPREGTMAIALIGFATFWNSISIPAAFFTLAEGFQLGPHLFVFLFPVIGLGIMVGAGFCVLRWYRFRNARFDLDTLPGEIGGPLRGALRLPAPLPRDTEVLILLEQCQMLRDSQGYSTEMVQWSETRRIHTEDLLKEGSLDRIPILFAIPAKARSCTSSGGEGIWWRLVFKAELPGPDLRISFHVPVFKVSEYRSDLPPESELTGERIAGSSQDAIDLEGWLAASGGRFLEQADGSLRIQLSPFQARNMHTVGLALTGIMTLSGIGLVAFGKWYGHLLIALGGFLTWLQLRSLLRSMELQVSHRGIQVTERTLGRDREIWLKWTDIDTIDFIETAGTSSRNGYIQYHDIVARPISGKKVRLLRWLVGNDGSEELVERIHALRHEG